MNVIQEILPSEYWSHIPSKLNPADCASRGTYVDELAASKLWWHGPQFLSLSEKERPKTLTVLSFEETPEKRKKLREVFVVTTEPNPILYRFSDLHRLTRFTAIAFRWIQIWKAKKANGNAKSVLSTEEIYDAKLFWIRLAQAEVFSIEISALSKGKEINGNSKLIQLNPYLDKQQILHMNGRVSNEEMIQQIN